MVIEQLHTSRNQLIIFR